MNAFWSPEPKLQGQDLSKSHNDGHIATLFLLCWAATMNKCNWRPKVTEDPESVNRAARGSGGATLAAFGANCGTAAVNRRLKTADFTLSLRLPLRPREGDNSDECKDIS